MSDSQSKLPVEDRLDIQELVNTAAKQSDETS